MSVYKVFALLCGLLLSVTTTAVFAADASRDFAYDIELQIPKSQRQMMEDHLDLYRWRGSERMDEVQLRRLVRLAPEQMREFLATEGYYQPGIAAEMVRRSGRWQVRLQVEPGEPVRISGLNIQVQGACQDDQATHDALIVKIYTEWGLPLGSVFRHADWEAAKRRTLKALLLDRYPTAVIVESHAVVEPQSGKADLSVVLNSGPGFTFGGLEIQGLRRYPASLIERMNPIRRGEPYSQSKLLALQSRLQDSPYFSSAIVSVDSDASRPSDVPVRVEVVEVQSRKLGVGIGMSTDVGPRGLVDYRDIGFGDNALRLSSALKLDRKKQTLGGDLQFPPDEDGHRDGVNALMERTDIAGEVTHKLVMGAKRTIPDGNSESVYGLSYSFERQNVNGAGGAVRNTLSPSYAWTLRDVDDVLNPSRGYLLNFQADAASRALLSDQDFLRAYGRGVYFHPFDRRNQLILRGELGVVAATSRNGIASSFLFRTGGDQTVRGYAYQSLGVQQAGGIVGGRYLALASAEYVHWLTPEWGGALFVDGGDAADTLGTLRPALGYGAGARWKSPIGPLNLDIAYGQQAQKWRLHFSLGFTF